MCRLMLVIGAKEGNGEKIKEFLTKASPILSKGNNDGLGFTAIKDDKTIFTKRWTKNDKAFSTNYSSTASEKLKSLKRFVMGCSFSNSSGIEDWSKVRSVLMHTRMKTQGDVDINNTHPFNNTDNTVSVVHNGQIYNHTKFEKLNSECDSEVILTEYLRNDVANNFNSMVDVISQFDGYWATAVTSLSGDRRVIDIVTSRELNDFGYGSSGALCVSYIEELEAFVLASNKSLITDTLKELKWNNSPDILNVNKEVLTRFDALTGEIIDQTSCPDNSNNNKQTEVKEKPKEEVKQITNNTKSLLGDSAVTDFYNNLIDDFFIDDDYDDGDTDDVDNDSTRYSKLTDSLSLQQMEELDEFYITLDKSLKERLDKLPIDLRYGAIASELHKIRG